PQVRERPARQPRAEPELEHLARSPAALARVAVPRPPPPPRRANRQRHLARRAQLSRIHRATRGRPRRARSTPNLRPSWIPEPRNWSATRGWGEAAATLA